MYDNFPPYNEDNETELYSMDSFREKWKESADNDLPLGTAVMECIQEYAIERNKYANDSYSVHKNYEPIEPHFAKWTLYDPVQHRAYASFIDEKDVLDFIQSSVFAALWQRIDMDRYLSLSERELNAESYIVRYMDKSPVFRLRQYELYPISFDSDDSGHDVPSKWQIRSTSADYLDVIKYTLRELNPEWKKQKDELPF